METAAGDVAARGPLYSYADIRHTRSSLTPSSSPRAREAERGAARHYLTVFISYLKLNQLKILEQQNATFTLHITV